MPRKLRTEHAGAKNGGGHWGTRDEAKVLSRKQRREDGKREVAEGVRIFITTRVNLFDAVMAAREELQ